MNKNSLEIIYAIMIFSLYKGPIVNYVPGGGGGGWGGGGLQKSVVFEN